MRAIPDCRQLIPPFFRYSPQFFYYMTIWYAVSQRVPGCQLRGHLPGRRPAHLLVQCIGNDRQFLDHVRRVVPYHEEHVGTARKPQKREMGPGRAKVDAIEVAGGLEIQQSRRTREHPSITRPVVEGRVLGLVEGGHPRRADIGGRPGLSRPHFRCPGRNLRHHQRSIWFRRRRENASATCQSRAQRADCYWPNHRAQHSRCFSRN